MDKTKGFSPNHVFAQKSKWPYSMQSRFWMDKIKGLSTNHVFVQKSRWPYSMQSKFGMDKIQGSYKLGWLFGYLTSGYIFTSSKEVTDYLQVKGLWSVFKQKNYIMDENEPLSE